MSPHYPPIEHYEQEPEFHEVQTDIRHRYPDAWARLTVAVREVGQAAGPEGFTPEHLHDEAGDLPNPNVLGSFIGAMRVAGILKQVGRTKSTHPEAKGRWVCRWALVEPKERTP
jgi:hypothetical protein